MVVLSCWLLLLQGKAAAGSRERKSWREMSWTDFVPALPGAVWRTTRAIHKRHVSEVLEETLFPFISLTVTPKSKLLFIYKLFFTFLGSMTLLFA